ncbi:hypothetical protein O181_064739 [Austropuccinia psidii MF-1]|uniref:Uncharacterized protein n=1 Tax=Austropuccinia psidii MF-1 TaxID=1389203 RepID=A0A9Q3I3V1_9BASI|nr:hypothetical protein [Austropuccinia psidii MF-1]
MVFNTKILDLQSATIASLERIHVIVPGHCLLASGGIYGLEKMGLLGKSSQSLRHLLLMELQDLLNRDVARWTNVGGPNPVGGRPIYSSSEVPTSRINTEGVVKRIRRIADSSTDPDAEGSDELDGEKVEVVLHLVGHPSSNSSAQPLSNRFQSQVVPSTPRTFQPALASIPTTITPSSPSTSHARPALNQAVRPSPSQQSRNSPITTSRQLQPVASSSSRRDDLSPLPFPALKFFKEEIVGLSKLPEKIPMWQVKTKNLWPDYSGGLIEIEGMLLSMLMIELFWVLLLKRWLQNLPGMKMNS